MAGNQRRAWYPVSCTLHVQKCDESARFGFLGGSRFLQLTDGGLWKRLRGILGQALISAGASPVVLQLSSPAGRHNRESGCRHRSCSAVGTFPNIPFPEQQYNDILNDADWLVDQRVTHVERDVYRRGLHIFIELPRWTGTDIGDAVQFRPAMVGADGVLRYMRTKTGIQRTSGACAGLPSNAGRGSLRRRQATRAQNTPDDSGVRSPVASVHG